MSEAAVQVPETNIIVLFPEKTEGEKTQSEAQKAMTPEPEEIPVPKAESKYSKDWTCIADGIYRYEPSGTLFYRPTNPDGGRTYQSLKTKNSKVAVERYQKLKAPKGMSPRAN